MDENYLAQIRDVLLKSMDDQYAVDKEALNTSQLLGKQKIMYANDARGTLYSGQPTWDRAQLASQGTTNLAKLDKSYLSNKLNVWNNITNTLDQINSYNKAAAAMNKAANKTTSSSGNTAYDQVVTQMWNTLYENLKGGE